MQPDDAQDTSDLSAASAMLRLMTGYQLSQAIAVAAHLGIADLLRAPQSAAELASQVKAQPAALHRLLRTLTAYELLAEDEAGRFTLTALGRLLRADAPLSLRAVALQYSHDNFWQSWGDLLHCVQTGESAMSHLYGAPNPFVYYRQHPEVGAVMNASFVAQARVRAQAVVAAYDFAGSGVIVDVGGNLGQLLATILRAHPTLRGVLFDLPNVVAQASPLLDDAGVAERITRVGGDMFANVPSGGDTYLLSNIIHDWDDDQASAILRNCAQAMPPQTTLLIIERVLPTRMDHTAQTQQATLMDLNMLVRTGGQERTEGEYMALLDQAGFTLRAIIPTASGYSVIQAERNAAA